MLGQTLRSLLAAALAIAAGGCITDETSSTTGDKAAQPITITLSLANPKRCCAQVIEIPDAAHPFVLPIEVKVEGTGASKLFVLRPPGYCRFGGLPQCGHLAVEVNRLDSQGKVIENVTRVGSTKVIEVPLSGPGDVTVAVTAFDDDNMTLAESPVITVSTQTSCPPLAADAPCPAGSSSGGGS